jgi:hypothetical protein
MERDLLRKQRSSSPKTAIGVGERELRIPVIDAEKTSFPIAFMCRRLGVSTAGYYAWLKRPPSARAIADVHLTKLIQHTHAGSRV